MSSMSMDLGTMIRRRRRSEKLRQVDLATRFGIDQSTLSKWEVGAQRPEPHHMGNIAEFLRISKEEAFTAYLQDASPDAEASSVSLGEQLEGLRNDVADIRRLLTELIEQLRSQ